MKTNKIPENIKIEVLEKFNTKKQTVYQLSKNYNISRRTLYRWINEPTNNTHKGLVDVTNIIKDTTNTSNITIRINNINIECSIITLVKLIRALEQ